jgi:hypothetical protein
VNRPLAEPPIRRVRTSLGAVSHKFCSNTAHRYGLEGALMFHLPAYDPTAIAMLGFGILAALSLPFIF